MPEKSSAVRISILVCGHINAGTCKIWGSQKIVHAVFMHKDAKQFTSFEKRFPQAILEKL